MDTVLYTAGTAVGLLVAAAIPYLMALRHALKPGSASPVWILPVVAAALGPLLLPHLPAGQWQQALLLGCYAMFGQSRRTARTHTEIRRKRMVYMGVPATSEACAFILRRGAPAR